MIEKKEIQNIRYPGTRLTAFSTPHITLCPIKKDTPFPVIDISFVHGIQYLLPLSALTTNDISGSFSDGVWETHFFVYLVSSFPEFDGDGVA
ncbi:hypothetical protein CDAR_545111 [Caerostris darwini]|uniref:Uncharacterized protein n=1 Tax=Caerostris darwini TaxID=1538125 RepID=A0AAV4TK43_9ARAC|nr:hypothetical protein CDAR_545111 [Caerostris darwini]